MSRGEYYNDGADANSKMLREVAQYSSRHGAITIAPWRPRLQVSRPTQPLTMATKRHGVSKVRSLTPLMLCSLLNLLIHLKHYSTLDPSLDPTTNAVSRSHHQSA